MTDETAATFTPVHPPWPDYNPARPQVRYDTDAAFHQLYDEALAATGMRDRPIRRQRHYLIPQLIRQVLEVSGDVVEIGCFQGLSAYVACATLETEGLSLPFHIFDSFEGLSNVAEVDVSPFRPAVGREVGNLFAFPEEQVRRNLERFAFVQYHRGWVPERFPALAETRFRFIHVDVDLYQPTRDTIEFFWPRLSPRGLMLFDDYSTLFWPGARQAIEEFFGGRTDALRVGTTAGSGFAVKLA